MEKFTPIVASLDALDNAGAIEPKILLENTEYPVVGVLYIGIANNEFLKP